MIKKGIIKATIMGGVLVMVFSLIIGLVLGFIFLPATMAADLILVVLGLAITSFIAGMLTVYIIMKQTIKQFMPLIESLMGPKKK
jgi:FtsH-binding integral membrane protein